MKRKWLIGILTLLVCICGIIGFTACKNESNNLKFALLKGGKSYSVVGTIGSPTKVDIPATYKGKPVTTIGDWAFYECSSLTSVTIPDSVTNISGAAFMRCTSLTSITIPDSVTYTSEGAFSGCPIENATIPTSAIGGIPKSKLKSVIITSGSSIGENAFSGCYSLTHITLPNSITEIGEWAFKGCSNLTSITIPECVTEIGANAFYDCTALTNITIPDSVTEIGECAFYACTSLTSVTIGSGVKSIGISAFSGCTLLETITVASENTNYHSAGNCLIETKSKTLILGYKNCVIPIDGSVTSIGDFAFSDYTSLTSITIPDCITKIGFGAFSDCPALTSINIPDSVTEIGECAFQHCTSLESVTIGNGVTYIGADAFRRCISLESVTFKNTDGWKAENISFSSTELANPATAATFLTDTYCRYYWQRG